MTLRYVNLSASEILPSESELAARTRTPKGEHLTELSETVERLSALAQPAAMLAYAERDEALTELLSLSGGEFENSRYIAMIAVTLGYAVDRELARAARGGAASAFLPDAVSSAMAEAAADAAEEHLRRLTPKIRWGRRRSPGYGTLPLSLQPILLSVTAADKQLGITLTGSGMMLPSKTITALLGGNDEAEHFV